MRRSKLALVALAASLTLASCNLFSSEPGLDEFNYASMPNAVGLVDESASFIDLHKVRLIEHIPADVLDLSTDSRFSYALEDYTLMMLGDENYLEARFTRSDGECNLVALPVSVDFTSNGGIVAFTPGQSHSCSGHNCQACSFVTQGETITGCRCDMAGDISHGAPHPYCNHSVTSVIIVSPS